MLVRNSALALESYSEYQRSQQNLTVTLENGRMVDDGTPANRLMSSLQMRQESVQVSISQYAQSLLTNERNNPKPASSFNPPASSGDELESGDSVGDSRLLILKKLLEALTGKSFDMPEFQQPSSDDGEVFTPPPQGSNDASTPGSGRTLVGMSLIQEYEYTSVSMSGRIDLADGTSIEMSMSITMERSYQQTAVSVLQERGMLKDPLAISFNGSAVSLSSSATFEFDLNSDGQSEMFASLNSNAAFIALDLNSDGNINNGGELFGANSGNGFADLAKYDEDSNGFIDAGDSVFDKLLAWNPSSGLMSKLADLGVGALYTQSVDSPFKLNDANNRNLGVIRGSGFYLNEERGAGVLQQVDLRG
jgi:hypothetical protein